MATTSSGSRLPRPGDVLPFGYLWSHESDVGRDDAVTERPCVVVLAVGDGPSPQVLVAPITSRDPNRAEAIGLPGGVVGLERPSWIIPWELNLFQWPGPDVGRAIHPFGAWWRMGALTPALRRRLRVAVETALAARRAAVIRRTD